MDVKSVFQTIHGDWIEKFYDEIISKLDVGLITILVKHRLYEHFRQDEVNSVISMNIVLQMNGSWQQK